VLAGLPSKYKTILEEGGNTMDILAVGANAADAISLIDTVDELLEPLTQDEPGHDLTQEEIYTLSRRARMIDSTLRAARGKVEEIVKLIVSTE
jgi:hypothetical protein